MISYCSRQPCHVFHREERHMYYSFIQTLENKWDSCIGVCMSFNDMYMTNFGEISRILKDSITYMAVSGNIIDFSGDGYVAVTKDLNNHSADINVSFEQLAETISKLERDFRPLPPFEYGVSSEQFRICSHTENHQYIIAESLKHPFTIISNGPPSAPSTYSERASSLCRRANLKLLSFLRRIMKNQKES